MLTSFQSHVLATLARLGQTNQDQLFTALWPEGFNLLSIGALESIQPMIDNGLISERRNTQYVYSITPKGQDVLANQKASD
jgi:predicted transcriptional regulator